jgi:hypothetical protein
VVAAAGLMPPTLGLKPTTLQKLQKLQKLDGRRIEPTTCVPSSRDHAAGHRGGGAAVRAARGARGVPRIARAARLGRRELGHHGLAENNDAGLAHAATVAASRPVRQPTNSGDPCLVGMSVVSMMSLIATGMPSIGDSGRPLRQRPVERSAVARAAAMS